MAGVFLREMAAAPGAESEIDSATSLRRREPRIWRHFSTEVVRLL